MRARRSALAITLLALTTPTRPAVGDDTAALTAPAACAGRDGWSEPTVPQRIFGNVWYVGTCGISVVLITTPAGHVVIDGGPSDAGGLVAASIMRAGFALADVRWIVSAHEHFDHAGGIAELQRLTGARVAARAPTAAVLRSGRWSPQDPQAGELTAFPRVRVDQVIADGGTLTVGDLTVTAHATPAHSPGSTSWTWRSCEGDVCHGFAYADSISAISADGYRFADHPGRLVMFRRALDRVASLACDVVITPHPGASALFERLDGRAPLAEVGACVAYAARGRAGLAERLAGE